MFPPCFPHTISPPTEGNNSIDINFIQRESVKIGDNKRVKTN